MEETKQESVEISFDMNRVEALLSKFSAAAEGYNQGEIALAFSAFIAEQAVAAHVLGVFDKARAEAKVS